MIIDISRIRKRILTNAIIAKILKGKVENNHFVQKEIESLQKQKLDQ